MNAVVESIVIRETIQDRYGRNSVQPRIGWVDCAKGVGIILVVFGHVWIGLGPSGRIAPRIYAIVLSAIYSFHMPLFMFLSGLFADRSTGRNLPSFLAQTAGAILYPYLVWSLIQGSINIRFSAESNIPLSPRELALRTLVGAYAQFWFLYALFFCHIFYYTLRRFGAGHPLLVLLGIAAFLTGPKLPTSWWWTAPRAFCQYFVYMAAAAGVARPLLAGLQVVRRGFVQLAAVILSLGIICLVLVLPARPDGNRSDCLGLAALLAFLGIFAVVSVSTLLARANSSRGVGKIVSRFTGWLGMATLPVYVGHIIATVGTRVTLHRLFHVNSIVAHVVAGTAAGLLIPSILWQALGKECGFLLVLNSNTKAAPLVGEKARFPGDQGIETSK